MAASRRLKGKEEIGHPREEGERVSLMCLARSCVLDFSPTVKAT